MADEIDILNEELNWNHAKKKKSLKKLIVFKPPGVHAMSYFTTLYVALMWVTTLIVGSRFYTAPSNFVIDLKSILLLFVMGVELVVAISFAKKTWIFLGSQLRTKLRPKFKYGMWPPMFFTILSVGFMVNLVKPTFVKILLNQKISLSSSSDWEFPKGGRYSSGEVVYGIAMRMCEELGESWSIPTANSARTLSPPLKKNSPDRYWVIQEKIDAKVGTLLWNDCSKNECVANVESFTHSEEGQLKANVICLKRKP